MGVNTLEPSLIFIIFSTSREEKVYLSSFLYTVKDICFYLHNFWKEIPPLLYILLINYFIHNIKWLSLIRGKPEDQKKKD